MGRFTKYFFSFFKRAWVFSDYPITYRKNNMATLPGPDGSSPVPWFVSIDRWFSMMGAGQTKEEALEELRQTFDRYRSSGKPLPRPGTRGPSLESAPREQICQYEDLASEFFKRVLHLDYCDVFVTDRSSLYDFCLVEEPEQAARNIALVYGIDIGNIEDGNLVRVFERIRARNRQPAKNA